MPQHFIVNPSNAVYIKFVEGANFAGNNWSGSNTSVQQLLLIPPNSRAINLETLLGSATGDSILLKNLKEGTQMVIYHSTKSFIEMDASHFNAYLDEEGLTAATAYRSSHGEENTAAKTNFQYCAKTVFNVGEVPSDNITQNSTLPLDIVPSKSLFLKAKKNTLKLKFTVYFKGKPLANHSIIAIHKLASGQVESTKLHTDKNGRVKLEIDQHGSWMLSCTQMLHNEDAKISWQGYRGSLTWGYE